MDVIPDYQEPIQLGEELSQDPHALYPRLRPGGPARPVILPNEWPGWLVTSYEDARRLLADARLSKDVTRAVGLFPPGTARAYESPLVAGMLNSDPPDHTRLRRLVTKAFTAGAVEQLRPRIEQAADGLLDAMPADSTVDLLDAYALPLPITVICELLGVRAADRDEFRAWTLAFVTNTPEVELAEAGRRLTAYLTALISDKKSSPADDLLSRLVQVSDEDGQLSAAETLSMAFLLLVAGFETTVNLIANGVRALLHHPGQLALLRSEPSRLPGAIEEILRFDGPLHIATVRFTTEPVPAGDTEIPAGQLVHVSLLAANRDGDRFPDPDRFDITRQPAGHLAFGHGIHHCVGAPLARLEGQVAIGRLLRRFPGITLDGDPGGLAWRDSTLMHGLISLPVRLS
ncbi:MAG TPA: cytochrome P450 [Trebonia sp.]|nr:cytochrome P450 [Trebonia sp.]